MTRKTKNPNYKGNPDIYKYGFKTDREESCTAQINVRIPPSHKAKLKQVKGWQEKLRETINELISEAPEKAEDILDQAA